MPLGANHGANLRRQFLDKQLITTNIGSNNIFTEKQINNIKKWITRYRRNWDIFCDEVLQINLYPIQKVTLHMMGVSDVFFDMATRGSAKSFLVGVGAMCEFCLKPYSEIVITSSTISQASKLVEKKIRDEIIKKLSPYLLYMYEHEYIVITKSNTGDGGYTIENKLNGSTIKILPCLDSARGERSTWNIYEEARLLKKSILDSVFEPMGHSRPAKYLLKKEYQTKRWLETSRSTYITSARYKYEWFWREYKNVVTNYYISSKEKYIPFAEDIFAAISDGSRTWADYRKNKRQMNEMDFRMEILNEMIGEAEDAFFNYEKFKTAQILQECFIPPTDTQFFLGDIPEFRTKTSEEVRIVAVDYAFTDTTGKEKSDNTIIVCMAGFWKGMRLERHVEYMEIHSGSDSIGACNRVRELYWDYKADFLVEDNRSGGEVLFNHLTEPFNHPTRGLNWDKRGLTIADNYNYHIVSQAKLNDLLSRTVDPNAVHCVIPIIATSEINSACWMDLRKQLESKNLQLLVTAQDHQTNLEDNGKYFQLTTEDLVQDLLPYGQVDMMVQEAVNLKTEIKGNYIKLVEPRNGTKDRAVIVAYANYIMSLIENEWARQSQQEDYDLDSIQLVW